MPKRFYMNANEEMLAGGSADADVDYPEADPNVI